MLIGLDGNEANVSNPVGSGVYARSLLLEFAKNENHSFLIYLKDKPLSNLPKNTQNFSYKVFGPKKLWTRFALPIKLTVGKKPDIFFSMGHYGPRFSKVPYVVTIFDLSYIFFPQMFKKEDLYQLTNWSKHSILNAKHIFAISNKTKDDIVKNYSVDPSKITVTYMGYDQERFKLESSSKINAAKKKYGIPSEYIIFIGTLQPRKNIEKLLEAFKLIVNSSQLSDLSLVIAGKKGWMYEQIFQKVKDLRLERKIIFCDFVPDEDLPALISGAKAYVLPSLWEGFGIPVIEAQACGVPAVVSNVSSLPEVLGDSAVLFNPNDTKSISDSLLKVLTDKRLAGELTKKGIINAKRFSWQKCASETLSVLEKLSH